MIPQNLHSVKGHILIYMWTKYWNPPVWKVCERVQMSQRTQRDSSFVEEDIIKSRAKVWAIKHKQMCWPAKTHSLSFYMNLLPPEPTLVYVCGLWGTITSLTPSSRLYNNNLQCAEALTSNFLHQREKKLDIRTCLMYSRVKKKKKKKWFLFTLISEGPLKK